MNWTDAACAGQRAREDCWLKKRILVVDDDLLIQELIGNALSEKGYAVSEAGDGLEALEQVTSADFDIILLDLQMPRMDGWSFLESYSKLPGPHAPVIVCTAEASTDRQGTTLEAAGYLQKPFYLDELYACVDRCMG